MDQDLFERVCAQAADHINALIDNGFLEHGPDWTKSWYDLSLRWSRTDPSYVQLAPESTARLVSLAEDNVEIFELAMFVAGSRLECDVKVPDELRSFVSQYLMGCVTPPKPGPGRNRKQTWGRDFVVIDVMMLIFRDYELAASQNRERSTEGDYEENASEIVEHAIQRSRLDNLRRTQIEKIWSNKKKRQEHRETCKFEIFSDLDDANGIVRI